MICYHHNDLDGRCAAAIVKKYYPECRMREITYDENPNFSMELQSGLSIGEEVIIVDFSFKPEKMKELYQHTSPANIIWIDHHNTAKEYDYGCLLGGLRDFLEPGLSGCELTWKYFFPDEDIPEAVRLLGDYDTWRFDTKEHTMAFQFGMRAKYNMPQSPIWHDLLSDRFTASISLIKGNGEAILDYQKQISEIFFKGRYTREFEGYKVLIVNVNLFAMGSNMFDYLSQSEKDHHDFYVAWFFNGMSYNVSLRSRKDIDVSEIAKKYGGGGHKGAAGFVCDKLPF